MANESNESVELGTMGPRKTAKSDPVRSGSKPIAIPGRAGAQGKTSSSLTGKFPIGTYHSPLLFPHQNANSDSTSTSTSDSSAESKLEPKSKSKSKSESNSDPNFGSEFEFGSKSEPGSSELQFVMDGEDAGATTGEKGDATTLFSNPQPSTDETVLKNWKSLFSNFSK